MLAPLIVTLLLALVVVSAVAAWRVATRRDPETARDHKPAFMPRYRRPYVQVTGQVAGSETARVTALYGPFRNAAEALSYRVEWTRRYEGRARMRWLNPESYAAAHAWEVAPVDEPHRLDTYRKPRSIA